MGYWLNAFCTEQTADVLDAFDDFVESVDLTELEIEVGGIESFSPQRVRDCIRVEIAPPLEPPFHHTWCAVVYGDEDGEVIGWDHYVGQDALLQTIGVESGLADSDLDDEFADRIRDVLRRTVEVVSTRLPDSSVHDISFPFAREMAIWIATRCSGIVQLDDNWFDPIIGRWS